MNHLGDSHNFGQRVSLDPSDNSKILKPRTVFWEWFFLDQSSPLRTFLADHKEAQLSAALGSIQVCPDPQLDCGTSQRVISVARRLELHDFNQIGTLTAIALTFGITDLHRDNVLITSQGLQIVDIECLLWDSQLPSETLLLPAGQEQWHKSILGAAPGEPVAALTTEQFDALLSGFFKGMSELIKLADSIVTLLQRQELAKIPIRFILRNTADYRAHLDGHKHMEDLIPEERAQLLRGDIPYFFGFLGNRDVHFFKEPQSTLLVNSTATFFQDKLNRSFGALEHQFSHQRLVRIFKQALVEMSHKFIERQALPFRNDYACIFEAGGFLNIKTDQFGVRTAIK